MATIPEKYLDLLTDEKKAFAILATVQPDGTPQVTPLWFDYVDGKLRINTAIGRVKHRNMSKNSAVALAIMDPANPYRYLQVRGRVSEGIEEGADAHIDRLAMKYMGKEKYPFARPDEKRIMYVIEPASFQSMG